MVCLIDWILPLPDELERQVFQRIHGEKPVNYISYAERLGMEQGQRAAFLRSIQLLLKAKFGEEGEALLAKLPEQTPLDRLELLVTMVASATTLEALRPQFTQG